MSHRLARPAVLTLLAAALAGCCCGTQAPATTTTTDVAPAGTRQVFIDMTTLRIPADRADTILGELRHRGATRASTLTKPQAERLKAALDGASTVHVVAAPKMLALEGQEASVFIGETIHFARTSVTTNAQGGVQFGIDDMAGSPVFLGHKLRIVATPSTAGDEIHLDFRQLFREPLEAVDKETIAQHTPQSFLRDHVHEARLETTVRIPDGGYAMLGNPHVRRDKDGRHLRVTLLSARLIEDEAPRRLSSPPSLPPIP